MILATVRGNAGFAVTGATAVFVVVRLLAVANMNPLTALAILQTLGPANVVVGTLLAILPPAIGLVGFAATGLALKAPPSERKPFVLTAVAFLAVSFFMVPWLLDVFLFAGLLSVVFQRSGRAPRSRRGSLSRVGRGFNHGLDAAVCLGLALVVLTIQPWLAPERVTTPDGHTIVGFVLEDGTNGSVILRDSDRHVLYFNTRLQKRSICRPTSDASNVVPLYQLFVGAANYPRCK